MLRPLSRLQRSEAVARAVHPPMLLTLGTRRMPSPWREWGASEVPVQQVPHLAAFAASISPRPQVIHRHWDPPRTSCRIVSLVFRPLSDGSVHEKKKTMPPTIQPRVSGFFGVFTPSCRPAMPPCSSSCGPITASLPICRSMYCVHRGDEPT